MKVAFVDALLKLREFSRFKTEGRLLVVFIHRDFAFDQMATMSEGSTNLSLTLKLTTDNSTANCQPPTVNYAWSLVFSLSAARFIVSSSTPQDFLLTSA